MQTQCEGKHRESEIVTVEMMQFPCCGGNNPGSEAPGEPGAERALSLPGRSWELLPLCAAGPEELREELSVFP